MFFIVSSRQHGRQATAFGETTRKRTDSHQNGKLLRKRHHKKDRALIPNRNIPSGEGELPSGPNGEMG